MTSVKFNENNKNFISWKDEVIEKVEAKIASLKHKVKYHKVSSVLDRPDIQDYLNEIYSKSLAQRATSGLPASYISLCGSISNYSRQICIDSNSSFEIDSLLQYYSFQVNLEVLQDIRHLRENLTVES